VRADTTQAREILLRRLLRQAEWCEQLGSPFSAALLRHAAEDLDGAGPTWAVLEGFETEDGAAALALRLLAAVQGLRGGEHCGRFAREHAGQPQAPRAVEEVLQRCGHVAEARRAAEHQCVCLAQILECGVRRPARRHRLGRGGAFGVHRRHGSQPRTGARNSLHAAAHVARELGGRAAARVVEHQYLRHAVLLRPRTGRGAARRTLPQNDAGIICARHARADLK